jgi:RecJ-like exonuclease
MKCDCPECRGTGTVECEECDGTGELSVAAGRFPIPKDHPKYAELLALQADERRVKWQAEELARLNPARSEAYQAQLAGCLQTIDTQVNDLAKKR